MFFPEFFLLVETIIETLGKSVFKHEVPGFIIIIISEILKFLKVEANPSFWKRILKLMMVSATRKENCK